MSLMRRLSLIFRSKASRALNAAEDPRETLDYSYERQMDLLQQMRRSVTDVATARKRVELQAQQLQQTANKLDNQAREALARRAAIRSQAAELKQQHEQLSAEEAKLVDASRRLEAKIQAFRTRKETIKATYSAAEAQAKVGEALSGISEEMGDVGFAMQRAEDKVASMQARSGAVDELMASGALEDLSGSSDPLQAELDRISASTGVDAELDEMKRELQSGERAALESSEEEEKS